MDIFFLFPNTIIEKFDFSPYKLIFFIEDPHFFSTLPFHKQRLVFLRASFRAYQHYIQTRFQVETTYVDSDAVAKRIFDSSRIQYAKSITMFDPVDHDIRQTYVRQFKQLIVLDSPLFLETPDELVQFKNSTKNNYYRHDVFYKWQRNRLNLLLDTNNKPLYGQYSFDRFNRQPYSSTDKEPKQLRHKSNEFIREAITYVTEHFSDHFGEVTEFNYPVTFADAKRHFKHFLTHKLDTYGKFQDAVSKRIPFGSHSLVSALLNVGLLSVQYVVDETLKVFRKSTNKSVLIYSVEAFVRQIIGWRSYVRFIYHFHGPQIKQMNYFGHQGKLNRKWFHLDGKQMGIPLIDFLIEKAKQYAYLNHIERLMFMGNFMLLTRLHPNEVCKWFMIVSIDSFDWVMVPNVFGMSQYALENMTMMTRPYLSSSKYIFKMSDFSDDLVDQEEYTTSELWTSLFYKFIDDHQTKLVRNYFFKPIINKWKKKSTKEKQSIVEISTHYLYSV